MRFYITHDYVTVMCDQLCVTPCHVMQQFVTVTYNVMLNPNPKFKE